MHVFLLLVAVISCSTAVLFIKESTVHPMLLSGHRLLYAAVLLSPMFFRALKAVPAGGYGWHMLRRAFPAAALLAVHFITWAWGARHTDAANGSLIVNMVPLVVPFLLHAAVGEKVTRREWTGTIVAVAGILVMTAGDYHLTPKNLPGDAVCLLSMIILSFYMVEGRRNRDFPSVWLYIVPLYAMAGIFCLLASTPFVNPLQIFPAREYLWLLALALIPTILGHGLLNRSLKYLRGQVVSVANLLQFLFAALLCFLVRDEIPQPLFYPAALLVCIGAALAIFAPHPASSAPQAD